MVFFVWFEYMTVFIYSKCLTQKPICTFYIMTVSFIIGFISQAN